MLTREAPSASNLRSLGLARRGVILTDYLHYPNLLLGPNSFLRGCSTRRPYMSMFTKYTQCSVPKYAY